MVFLERKLAFRDRSLLFESDALAKKKWLNFSETLYITLLQSKAIRRANENREQQREGWAAAAMRPICVY